MPYVANLEAVSADGNWSETFYLFDQSSGGMIDLTGWTFKMGFNPGRCRGGWWSSGYQASSSAGTINYIGNGAFVVALPLSHGLYDIILEITRTSDGYVLPLLTGTLAIQRGLGTWQ